MNAAQHDPLNVNPLPAQPPPSTPSPAKQFRQDMASQVCASISERISSHLLSMPPDHHGTFSITVKIYNGQVKHVNFSPSFTDTFDWQGHKPDSEPGKTIIPPLRSQR